MNKIAHRHIGTSCMKNTSNGTYSNIVCLDGLDVWWCALVSAWVTVELGLKSDCAACELCVRNRTQTLTQTHTQAGRASVWQREEEKKFDFCLGLGSCSCCRRRCHYYQFHKFTQQSAHVFNVECECESYAVWPSQCGIICFFFGFSLVVPLAVSQPIGVCLRVCVGCFVSIIFCWFVGSGTLAAYLHSGWVINEWSRVHSVHPTYREISWQYALIGVVT